MVTKRGVSVRFFAKPGGYKMPWKGVGTARPYADLRMGE